jgi:FAD/FMN-containing dehydrogenase
MEQGKELVERAIRDLEASSKTSRTGAGPTEPRRDEDLVDAINQVFALFRLNYHNQYYSAFGDAAQLNQIKRLWLDSLAAHSPETILLGARRCIETSEYLPTLARMLECCQQARLSAQGLPDAHAAYREACLAPEPKQAQRWSHPAVFHAGRETGWFFLASTAESKAFPMFEKHYRAVCERIVSGEVLELPAPDASRTAAATLAASDADEQRARLAKLRAETGIL